MKRKATEAIKTARSSDDLDANFSPAQLQAIGWIAIAATRLESQIDYILTKALKLPWNTRYTVIQSLRGYEAKRDIAKKVLKADLQIPALYQKAIDLSLDAASECKSYRDAVIHSYPMDAATNVNLYQKKAGELYEVLVTPEALGILQVRMRIVKEELTCVAQIVLQSTPVAAQADATAERKARLLRAKLAQGWFEKLESHQKRRKSLKPLPPFPK